MACYCWSPMACFCRAVMPTFETCSKVYAIVTSKLALFRGKLYKQAERKVVRSLHVSTKPLDERRDDRVHASKENLT